MRIATWNINSLRARMDRLLAVIEARRIDVIALQEIKAKPEQLDLSRLEELGFEVSAHGLNQWNGVAIASRVGLSDVRTTIDGLPAWGEGEDAVLEARAIGARVGELSPDSRPLDLWSLYVPNGRELDHPHYAYKLHWLEAVRAYGASRLAEGGPGEDAGAGAATIFAGDFNVAPTDADVWDIAAFAGKTHVSGPERDAITALAEAGYADVTRDWLDTPGTFTYWDYKGLKFTKKQGMRIDFLLASPAVRRATTGAMIDLDERAAEGTSDHAPVIIDVEL
ncbi:MAG: exodeoxyribonuclease III [Dermabacter sp.]|nr:exodeoxyribonuclease III [Dermabacter sp.]